MYVYSHKLPAWFLQIKTPTLIMLGEDDLRVPPKQGHELHKTLLAQNTETRCVSLLTVLTNVFSSLYCIELLFCRLLTYPNNCHPISGVEAEADAFLNTVKWFLRHLKLD